MIKLDILGDDNLCENLDIMISGMLPHENYDHTMFSKILQRVFSYIKLDEMVMEYYVVFSVFRQVSKINVSVSDYIPTITRDVIESIVTNNVMDLVRKPEVGVRKWLSSEGHPDNLEIETTLDLAAQKLYERVMELYDRCYEKSIDSNEALSYVPALKDSFLANVSESSVKTQVEILQGSVRIGRNVLTGSEGWLDYVRYVQASASQRVEEAEEGTLHVDSIDKSKELRGQLKSLHDPLGYYDIPTLDDKTPMLKHRMVILAGNEGTYKTTLAINMAVKLMVRGKTVVFMSGETPNPLIFSKIVSTYIYEKFGKFVTTQHIAGILETTEEIDKLINLAILEIQESKTLILKDSFSYANLYDELKEIMDDTPFDAVFIDHTLAMKGTGKPVENIGMASIQAREFKKNYPVYIAFLSHLSTAARDMVSKGKMVSVAPTAESSLLSREADEIFVLSKNDMLTKQGLLAVQVYKRRAPAIVDYIILKILGDVSAYIFDPRYQKGFESAKISAQAALEEIEDGYGDEDGYDDGYDDEWEEEGEELIDL